MSVKLAFAKNGTDIIHISERIQNKESLRCPHCLGKLGYRKGDKRAHHFYHLPGEDCSATSETILHYESKMYLKDKIIKKQDIGLGCSLSMLPYGIRNVMKALKLESYNLSLSEMMNTYKVQSATEEIKECGYIADVMAIGSEMIAFEILVTHAMENEKIEAFEANGINFIELIPERVGLSDFRYKIEIIHLPLFFKKWEEELNKLISPKIEENLFNRFKNQEKELYENVKREIMNDYKSEMPKEVMKRMKRKDSLVEVCKQEENFEKTINYKKGYREEKTIGYEIEAVNFQVKKTGNEKWILTVIGQIDEGFRSRQHSFMVMNPLKFFEILMNEMNKSFPITFKQNENGRVVSFTFNNLANRKQFFQNLKPVLIETLSEVVPEQKRKVK